MVQSSSSTGFSTNGDKAKSDHLAQLTAEHFQNHCQQICQRTDRMFAGLMALQWLAGIGVALWITPLTWIGAASSIHLRPCRDLPRRYHCRFPDPAGCFAAGAGDYPSCHRHRSNARIRAIDSSHWRTTRNPFSHFWLPGVSRLLPGLAGPCHGVNCRGARPFSPWHLLAALDIRDGNSGLLPLD